MSCPDGEEEVASYSVKKFFTIGSVTLPKGIDRGSGIRDPPSISLSLSFKKKGNVTPPFSINLLSTKCSTLSGEHEPSVFWVPSA